MIVPIDLIKEIGICYDEMFGRTEIFNSILACAINKQRKLFWCDKNKLYVGSIRCGTLSILHTIVMPETKIIDVCCDEEEYYCLTYTCNNTIVYHWTEDFLNADIFYVKYEGIPLSICVYDKLYIGFYKGYYCCYDKKFNLICKYNLLKYGLIAPTHIQVLKNSVVITDEYVNVVYEIDSDGKVLCSIGELNNNEVIYRPYFGTKTMDNTFLLCERRNHVVSEYNMQGELVWQYGIVGRAGMDNKRLWDPIAIFPSEEGYLVVLGKPRCIVYVIKNTKEYRILYGRKTMISTDWNYPRTCDWSDKYDSLAVANTALNEVLIYHNGYRTIITEADGIRLNNPRMVQWHDDLLVIADTRNKRMVFWGLHKETFVYKLSKININDWLMGFDILKQEKKMILLFKRYFLVVALDRGEVLWSSRQLFHTFKDMHQAEWYDDEHIVVANTGCHEIVLINIFTNKFRCFNRLLYAENIITLKNPRMIRRIGEFYYLINSECSDIYVLNSVDIQKVERVFSISEQNIYSRNCLNFPRWICKGEGNSLYITDTENQRVVVVNGE